MKKYFNIYLVLLKMTTAYILAHRLEAVVQMIFAPLYMLMLYFIMQVVLSKIPTLGGWTKDEIVLSFSVVSLLLSGAYFFYVEGIRDFMWHGIKNGDLDKVLVKPLNTALFVTLCQPSVMAVAWILGALGFFLHQVLSHSEIIYPTHLIVFIIVFCLCFLINYLTLSIYTTTAFYLTRATQMIEIFDKTSDFAHYPMTIFPFPLQVIGFTILPIGFFAYIPTLFLLGKGSWWLFLIVVAAVGVFLAINRLAWREGLKRYTSVSS